MTLLNYHFATPKFDTGSATLKAQASYLAYKSKYPDAKKLCVYLDEKLIYETTLPLLHENLSPQTRTLEAQKTEDFSQPANR